MVNQGERMNPLAPAYLMPRGYSNEQAENFERYNPVTRVDEQVWPFGKGNYSLQNPYWVAYRNLREMKRDRNMLSLGVSLDLKKWSATKK